VISSETTLKQDAVMNKNKTDAQKDFTGNKIIGFGHDVTGYEIPVLNEREIRAAAGLLFIIMFLSILLAILKGNFLMFKYSVTAFFTDMLIRVFINPEFSPFLIAGRLIVRNQVPEYVGAQQKKFAWVIGLALSATIFTLVVVVNSYSPISGIICMICLVFLFFETAFGICIGCKFYKIFYKEKARYCPGEVCDLRSKEKIQKTSGAQILIVFAFIVYLFLTVFLFNNEFSKRPTYLFGSESSIHKIKNVTK
jgi:hypothetical protein